METNSIIITFFILIGVAFFLNYYFSGKSAVTAKKDLFCISSDNNDLLTMVKLELEKLKISYTNMGRAPTQTAYNELGASEQTPAEIWIQKKDISSVKQLIKSKFKVEENEFALVIKELG